MKTAHIACLCLSLVAVQTATPSLCQTSAQTGTSASAPGSATEAMYHAAAASADAKFRHIVTNGASARPNSAPTVFTEREINAYASSGNLRLPKGVSRLRFSGQAGSVTANALVDFDMVTEGKRSSNPLMGLFSGTHQVEVVSHGQAIGGQARLHIDAVSIDGISVPRIALDYFVNRYIKRKYPNLGIDSQFTLPNRIDAAAIGDHNLIVIQK